VKIVARTQNPALSSQDKFTQNVVWWNQPLRSPLS